ncbi:hypothetical protein [Flavobacterium beibuense]|uniref:Uncharacterized protein n=1 Tax=Flavobacterium beibuense TaxID=657326 RepID=A0A444WGM8_9FLAO|nr:hypothetical protein [Flavobacterium beibuense]RYJ45028.1 hypothetical protein NU09_0662 [Flavobacterium beibuense]
MNKHFTALLLLISFAGFGQRYEFDTYSEYQFKKDEKTDVDKTFEFSNSKDNSYILSVLEKGKNVTITFLHASGQKAMLKMSKEDFFNEESIIVNCSSTEKQDLSNAKNSVISFDFQKLNDTIIKKDTLQHYVIRSVDPGAAKESGERHFIIQKSTEFHLPNVTPGTIPYFCWASGKTLPSGLFRQTYIVKDEELLEKMILTDYKKLKKVLVIERGCKY